MTELRFRCTACGKCCYGEIPLTLDDALANAGRFPLAMVWTPVHESLQAHNLTTQLGTTVQLPKGKKVAVLLSPTAYIPPGIMCPALEGNLCSIQNHKPIRCRAMPLYAYREEDAQADLLVPQKGWLCDTSETAPVVYKDKKILDREDFDHERKELLKNAPLFDAYAQKMLKEYAPLMPILMKAALNPKSGQRFALRFSSFLLMNKDYDIVSFAKQQHPILTAFEKKTAGISSFKEYHKYYKETADDLAWFAKRG